MTVSSAYHHLVARHETLLGSVTARVKESVAIERLYLLGLTQTQHCTETLFAAAPATRSEVTHSWLLAVVNEESPHVNNLSDKLETRLQPLVPSTVIVLSALAFRQWLAERHPFAAAVQEKGLLLYQKEEAGAGLLKALDEERAAAAHSCLLEQTRTRVREFVAGAELYTVRVQHNLAAFLLHQAAEQALRTALIVHTGLRLNTHSLHRLLRCCSLFCHRLAGVFPQKSQADWRLLQLLQEAYIGARYNDDYRIKGAELERLTQKVKSLYHLLFEAEQQPAFCTAVIG